MSKFTEYYEARNKIIEIVKEDLVGPVTEDEVIMEMPTSYYIMGKLYPDTKDIQDDDDFRTSADLEMLDMDNALAATNVYKPRSMGVTYSVLPDVDYIRVKIRFAMYLKYSLEEAEKENLNISRYKDDIEEMNENKKGRICFWKRDNKEFEYKVSTCTSSNIENGYEPAYGARPLRRFIQKHVETLAAKCILADEVSLQDTIMIDVSENGLYAKVV